MASEFAHVQKELYTIAASIDGQLRVYSMLMKDRFDELEVDYLTNRLQTEKDPLIGTIIAQLIGLREPQQEEEA